jgi:hypothetical protein
VSRHDFREQAESWIAKRKAAAAADVAATDGANALDAIVKGEY